MARFRLLLEYNGSSFCGWQRQPDQISIQETIEQALTTICRHEVELVASGRTDSGVHALGQVAHFDSQAEIDLVKLSKSLNGMLKPHIAVLAAEPADPDFHSRFTARAKVYQYRILNRTAPSPLLHERVWHVRKRLDRQFLQEQSKVLLGEHDFSSFRGPNCGAPSPIKYIESIELESCEELILVDICGRGFLKQMVRNIVGTLVELAQGKLKTSDLKEILEARDRSVAGVTAPSCGLYLKQVLYS